MQSEGKGKKKVAMGFWDDIRTGSAKLVNRVGNDKLPDTNVLQIPYDLSLAAVAKIGEAVRVEKAAQKLKEYLPDPDHREKIGRILTNIGKFAVESAINESLKGVTGGTQLYKIVQEGLKDQSPALCSNDKKKPDTITMEEMEAMVEKIQDELNNIKAKTKTAVAHAKEPDHLKRIPAEPVKGSDLLLTDKKRVMIRSRL